jgi:hypothetical protein
MKKLYFSILLLGAHSLSFGQIMPKPLVSNDISKVKPLKTNQKPNEKALGTVFWEDDFSTAANWTVNNSGQTGAEFGWSIDANSDGWYAANGINSTSGGNYAELSNGDPTATPGTQATGVTYTLTTAQPIDLSTQGTNISLVFEQFGARFNDLQEILVSTNGTTFFSVGDNSDKPVLSAAGGSAYANPDLKTINLAGLINGATQLWIQFSWTTAFPSEGTNPNVWVTYGWYIDDVQLTTNADYDLSVQSNYWGTAGLNYYQIPLTQVAPIYFSANVFNGGTLPMTGTTLNVNVNSGLYTGSSAPVTVSPLATDSLFTTAAFTPSNASTATYNVVRTLTTTEVDDIPTNNTFAPISFATTNYVYARDNGVTTGGGSTSNGNMGFETGNLFDIWQDQALTAINVRLAGGTVAGTEVYAKIYSINTDPNSTDLFTYEGESNPKVVTAANLNTNLILALQAPVNLTANTTYLAVVGSYDAGLVVANAGTSEEQTTFFLDMTDDTWYYQTGTPYVRLNFDPSAGIEETNEDVFAASVYPNPTSNSTSVNFTLNSASEVNVTVSDITGKVVEILMNETSVSGEQKISFDASSYANGAYYVTIATEGSTVTKKFMKK